MLNLYAARDRDSALTSEQFAQIAAMIDGFLVRRMFANVPTNQLNRLFIRLWHQLAHADDLVREVRNALSEKSQRWPTDAAFRQAFVHYPLYTDSRPNQRRLVLDRLEHSFGHREAVALDGLEIEHIIPQT